MKSRIYYSNCIIFAIKKWIKCGGYIIIRKSREGYWPHLIWCQDLKDAEIEHFQPVDHEENAYLMKFLFKGFVSKTDDEERIRRGE